MTQSSPKPRSHSSPTGATNNGDVETTASPPGNPDSPTRNLDETTASAENVAAALETPSPSRNITPFTGRISISKSHTAHRLVGGDGC
ncbi:uncharacterized protein BDZ99DRAFT_235109 [Mytilinidion resinicola]|uniref:Uncharacterized protein n=1 Tax=Mytilinidion resinicola TaxID=574789 RepID=A0A6A6YZX5_9PEZI|nr:uncharacterized protein BDZ99DRAFT_235109 [Mytilinidion resinicola]KAF2814310.1 hypothetical protein BDZ99DRAFT_235109 [Mytilinidion resinicola]